MGMVNKVVDHADLESVAVEGGREIERQGPTAQRMLKYSFNLIDDGLSASTLCGRSHPLGIHDRRGRRRSGLVPGKARPRLVTLPLALLSSAGLHQAPADREAPQKCRQGPLGGCPTWPWRAEA